MLKTSRILDHCGVLLKGERNLKKNRLIAMLISACLFSMVFLPTALAIDEETLTVNSRYGSKTLYLGDTGTGVRNVQYDLLHKRGFDPGPIDGKFGDKTRKAVYLLQGAASLTVDGYVGPKTKIALYYGY